MKLPYDMPTVIEKLDNIIIVYFIGPEHRKIHSFIHSFNEHMAHASLCAGTYGSKIRKIRAGIHSLTKETQKQRVRIDSNNP